MRAGNQSTTESQMLVSFQTHYAGESKIVIPADGFNATVDALASRLRSWGEMRLAEDLKVGLWTS